MKCLAFQNGIVGNKVGLSLQLLTENLTVTSVEAITDDGTSKMCKVDPQLVGATGLGRKRTCVKRPCREITS